MGWMKLNFVGVAGLVAVLSVGVQPTPAVACGHPPGARTFKPRKGVVRTSRPSQMLLVGNSSARLRRDLAEAGHSVEVEAGVGGAKKTSYAVVIVDSIDQAAEARTRFAHAIVVVRSGDVSADLRSVEDQVGRVPVETIQPRQIREAKRVAMPIDSMSVQDAHVRVLVRGAEDVSPPHAGVSPPAEKKPATIMTSPAKAEETPATQLQPSVVTTELHGEVYFKAGSAKLTGKGLAEATRWLTTNVDVHVVVEGYADPTGSSESNMTLSQSRAETVRDNLVSAGIDPSRIEVVSFGDTHMKYGSKDSRNRRVAIEAKK